MRHVIIFATIIALSPIVSPEAVADTAEPHQRLRCLEQS